MADSSLSPNPNYGLESLARIKLVGRESELADLHAKLQGPAPVAIVAVAGMGGIGKTALAQHYVQTHRGEYGGGCWYFKLNDRNLAAVVLQAASTYGWQVPESLAANTTLSGEEYERQIVNWCYGQWQAQFPGPKLLVIDDVPSYGAVKAYLPAPPHDGGIAVLMTSRQQFQPPVNRLDLGVLAPDAAVELFTRLVGDAGRVQGAEAEALCEWVGRLPLGIELVARYLAVQPNLAFAKLFQRLEDQRLQARALRQDPPAEMAYELTLEAAFLLSWVELDERTQTLAATLSLLAAAPIPAELVAAVLPDWEEEDWEEALDEQLAYRNLVQANGDGSYQLHPLVREFVQARLQGELAAQQAGCARAVARAMVEVAKEVPQTVTVTQQQGFAPVVPHLEAVTAVLPTLAADALEDDTDITWPYIGLARLAESQSLWVAAERWYTDCLHLSEQHFGPNHPDTASSLNNLAALYQSLGRYGEAEPLFSRALAIWETQLGPDHPLTAASLNNLAALYQSLGRYGEAEPLQIRDLEISEAQLGPDHPTTATSLNNLAALYRSMGRYREAEPLYKRALAICEAQLGPDHPTTATSLNNLAALYRSMGRYREAEPLYKRALAICEAQLGPDHPLTAGSLNNLAALYESMGHYGEAEPLFSRALTIREAQLGLDHPDTAGSLNNLAALYESMGRYGEAEPLYKRALAIREAQLGSAHPETANSLNNLAGLYESMGRYREAEPLYKRALAICEAQLGPDHSYTAISLNNLAGLYVATQRYTVAEPLYAQAVTSLLQSLGPDHPNTKTVFSGLVTCLQKAIAANQTAQLSDHPLTQALLQQLT